jgi:hypothetical protein
VPSPGSVLRASGHGLFGLQPPVAPATDIATIKEENEKESDDQADEKRVEEVPALRIELCSAYGP